MVFLAILSIDNFLILYENLNTSVDKEQPIGYITLRQQSLLIKYRCSLIQSGGGT